MYGYDWEYGFRFGRGYPKRRPAAYDREFWLRGYPGRLGRGPRYGYDYGWRRRRGPGRGEYGSAYPGYGGYPGSLQEGRYYGGGPGPGRSGGYATGYRGYDFGHQAGYRMGHMQAGPRGRGDFAREPFIPEVAYQRHPEYDRPQRELGDHWPEMGHDEEVRGRGWSDDEVRHAVRQNMQQDNWIDPSRIEVAVDEGVVTLRGEVDDYLQARFVWDDAWEAAGVRGVINQLTVRLDRTDEPHGDVVPQTSGDDTG